jgi:hypothetical protein
LVAKLANAGDYGKLAYAEALRSLGARGLAGAIEAAAAASRLARHVARANLAAKEVGYR